MNKKVALILMFIILGLLLSYHILIFTEQIPYDKVWAGRLNSVEEMKSFEAFSILLNLFIIAVLSVKYRLLNNGKKNKIIDILIWIFAVFFAFNTFGNLFSTNLLELIFGTLITLASSVLCFIIVRKEKAETP